MSFYTGGEKFEVTATRAAGEDAELHQHLAEVRPFALPIHPKEFA